MELIEHEVRFDIWCKECVYCNNKEDEEPCDECLVETVNEYSRKPVYFKQKD